MSTGQESSEDAFSHFAHDLHGGVLWSATTPALELSFVSDSAIELLGYPAQQWQSERGFLKRHVHKDDWSRLLEAIFDATAEGGVHTLQHRMLAADGSTLWAQTSIARAREGDGGPRVAALTVDITSVKRAEQAYRDSEAHARLMIENIRDYAVFMVSPDGTVASWNIGARRLGGFAAADIVGTPIARFFPQDELEKDIPRRMLSDARINGSAGYEGWVVRKQGSRFWAAMTANLVLDKGGRDRGFSIVIRDVSERKRNEDALRESELLLRLLIDSLTDYCVVMLSPDGRVSSWSPGAERLKGYKAEEILDQPFSRFFTREDVERGTPAALIERGAAQGQATYEGWMVRKGGATLWETVTLSAVRDRGGELRGFSIVGKDMTERMQAERTQAFLSEVGVILASSLDYHLTLDRIMHLATRNLANWCAVAITGEGELEPISVAHIDPEKERVLKQVMSSPRCQSRLREGIVTVLQTGEPELRADASAIGCVTESLGIDDPAVLSDLATQSYLCVPLTARGKMLGAMLFVSAPRKRYSREDLMLAQELGRRAALAVDHARLYQQAQAAIRVRDQVLAVVSHDLLNPVNTIQLLATQLAAEIHAGIKTTKVAERIRRATDRMLLMIRDLLDYSNIEAGKLRIEASSQDVASLVTEALELLQPIAAAKEIRIKEELEVTAARVRCDRDRILQVFSNLVGNAVKFSGRGGMITVRSQVERERVVFSVSDTGPGIPAADLPHIFDRYWQGEQNPRGTLGLGLAIAKAVVEAQGGTIWAQSTVGEGTTIFFTLPITG